MSQERITINYIASGQPRAYADSRTITRVQWERTPSMWAPYDPSQVKPSEVPWEPKYMDFETAERLLRQTWIGDIPWRKDVKHDLDYFVEYIKPINPKKAKDVMPWGKPDADVSDIWEFYICQPYTD